MAEAEARLWADSLKADSEIQHITPEEFTEWIATGTRFVFFGATYCPYTAEFNPLWLEIQRSFYNLGWDKIPHFGMRKVACAGIEDFCGAQHSMDGYPTVNLYEDGVFIEEIVDNNEVADAIAAHARMLLVKVEGSESVAKEMIHIGETPGTLPALDRSSSIATATTAVAATRLAEEGVAMIPFVHHSGRVGGLAEVMPYFAVVVGCTMVAALTSLVLWCRLRRKRPTYTPISGRANAQAVRYI
ncbi:hypothetical protein BC830DRAFT_1117055 [Chytriomyces sp. MP71]|nr:hypothetical protein BC830DRAFT_1117055 [Chytriomyces sp. MP71]